METIYRLNTQELNLAWLKSVKSLLPNQDIQITISPLSSEYQIDETLWTSASLNSPVFDFLNDAAENIYTLQDGTALADEK